MKTKIFAPMLLMAVILTMAGCYAPWHWIEGNGNVTEETRQMPRFDRVINEGNFDVYIIQDGLSEVTVEAESNLIPLIRTRVQGSTLEIDTKDDLRNNYPMKVYVHTDEIEELKLSGSGQVLAEQITAGNLEIGISGSGYVFFGGTAEDVDCNISGSGSMDLDLTADEIDAGISGSGDMEMWGVVRKGDFRISGSGSIRSYDLLQQECYANISGSGNMYVNVEDYLDVTISGSGSVYYMGQPVVETRITGSGNVIHP
jgi:hypothetical protein